MDVDDIAIERIAVEDLRADTSGVLIEQMGSLAYRAFREPPWNDDLEKPRLHFGLGVDLMRRNALALIAKAKASGKIAGYALGYEVLRESEDPRDLTLSAISGTTALDYLFEGGKRVFYGDTLCVDPDARRRQIAYGLVAAQIPVLRRRGIHLSHRAHRHERNRDAGPFCQARVRRAAGARCRISRADLLAAQALTCWRNLVPALAVASAAPLDPVVGTFVSSSDSAINLAHCRLTASQGRQMDKGGE